MATVAPAIGDPVNNTMPLVEADGLGGHVPYVRLDPTAQADADLPSGDQAIVAVLRVVEALLRQVRDECRATRLAVTERINEGNPVQHDFLELALAMRDTATVDSEEH